MNEPKPVSLAISASWIIPVVPRDRIYTDCTMIVDDHKILDIIPTRELKNRYQAKEYVDLKEHALLPGLVNSHGHAAMSLLKGFSDDLPLDIWLRDHMWPTEQQWVDTEFVRNGSQLALAEMLLSGTTTFADMYFFPEITASVVHEAGIRAVINFPVFDMVGAWANGADDCIHKGIQLHDTYRSHPLISTGFGPHSTYAVSEASLQRIATIAEELQSPIQIHLHETSKEIEDSLESTGKRPLQRLVDLGVISPLTQCVHMTQVSDDDIELIVNNGAHVVHCPQSNMKLASGLCPVQKLLEKDINVALGTDSAASNNDLDMFAEMQSAALLGKVVANSAEAVNANVALEMATINGAKALGMESQIGSLEPGKLADIIAVDLSAIELQPIYDVCRHLVYNNCGHRVNYVWVNGTALVKNRELTRLNTKEIDASSRHWREKIAGNK